MAILYLAPEFSPELASHVSESGVTRTGSPESGYAKTCALADRHAFYLVDILFMHLADVSGRKVDVMRNILRIHERQNVVKVAGIAETNHLCEA